MMNSIERAEDRILNEIKRCNELHYRFAKRLSRIATQPVYESLDSTTRNGKTYYSELWIEDGVRRRHYLGGEDVPEVKVIKEKHFLSKALKMLEKHKQKLEKSIEKLTEFSCSDVNDSLPKVYRLTAEHLKELEGLTQEEKWYKAALKDKALLDKQNGITHESGLKHKANDGTLLRSKSEVAIYNEFLSRAKPCIYEMPTHIHPYLLHPDFTFYSNRYDRVIIWEHAGMLGDPDYMQSFSERTDKYIRAGYTPCVDVIFTFDTMTGDLDAGMIKRLLDEYE